MVVKDRPNLDGARSGSDPYYEMIRIENTHEPWVEISST
jgi:hypothetical protein